MKKRILILSAVVLVISSAFVYKELNKGVDVAALNTKAKPQEDFYDFANGGWIKNNPIPASEGRWTAFNIVAERNNELLKRILENAALSQSITGSNTDKIGTFYRVAMDTVMINKYQFRPLMPLLKQIDEINNTEQLIGVIADLHLKGIPAAFNFDVSADVKNSTMYAPYLAQGGLGLPDKDYYLVENERNKSILLAYRDYISYLFRSLSKSGMADPIGPEKSAELVIEFEKGLAENSMSRTQRRNMELQYNPFAMEELKSRFNNLNFELYLKRLGVQQERIQKMIVMQTDFFNYLNNYINADLNIWKVYLKWKVVNATAPYLHDDAVNANFNFYGKKLTGTKEQKPRWKRVIAHANNMIGELVAQEFVKVAFTPESKQRVDEMVDNLREAFRDRIQKLEWMSEPTKLRALEKLNSFTRKLGYPEKWTDMSGLEIVTSSYVDNYFNSSKFWNIYNFNKLGTPVDKMEWEMLPQTVNAYYNPVNNEIVFPAAIMQPPFFDPNADDAMNYGAIGAVIGHEFSHGFDDQGSKYDAMGNLNSWWTEEDRAKFDERTKVLVDQFNKFEVLDSVYVNGELTLGENIADLAGLTVAYDAYQRYLKNKPRKMIDGYTPEQRFFIGFAQVWRGHARPEFLRQQVLTDPHSPARFRVMGPLSNMPQFYEAFGVKPGNAMYRNENQRVKIW